LCAKCWSVANEDTSRRAAQRENLSIYTLWDWVPHKNDALSHFLIAVKGGGLDRTWPLLADKLLHQRHLLGAKMPSDVLFIPAPPTQKKKKDHAYQLAKYLAQQTRSELLACLQKRTSLHQRRLSKTARAAVRIQKDEKISIPDLSQRNIIFVDDVVTTGGTALASLLALEPVKSMEVWALAQREASCGNRGALL
jgi:predicted amidophosphoribosyltransferase